MQSKYLLNCKQADPSINERKFHIFCSLSWFASAGIWKKNNLVHVFDFDGHDLIYSVYVIWSSKFSLMSVQFWVFYMILNYKLHLCWKPHQNWAFSSRGMSKCRFWKAIGNKRSCFLWWIIYYNQYCWQTDSAWSCHIYCYLIMPTPTASSW